MHAWGDHLSPILYLLVPLFRVAPGAVALLVFRSAALALGALAVFGIAAQRLGDERPAAVFAILYLLNPSLQGINHRTQYQSFVLPFLFAAAIAGYDRVALRRPGPWPKGVLVVALMASLVLSSRTMNNFSVERFWPKPVRRQAWEVIAQVPASAAVSAQDRYVAHLSLRPLVFVFPEEIGPVPPFPVAAGMVRLPDYARRRR